MRALEFVQRMQLVDRRIVYCALAIVLAVPFLVNYTLPIYPDTYTTLFYETLEEIAHDPVEREKIVLVLSQWGPGSDGENGPQLQVLCRHLLRRRLKFVLLSTADDPVNIALAATRLQWAIDDEQRRARRLGEPPPKWVYGTDYLNFGFKPFPVFETVAKTVVLDTRNFYKQDYLLKKPLTDENFPLLRSFHGVEDIALVLIVSHADEAKAVCGIVQRQVPDLKVAEATMGIVANDLYPYVKSGQLSGLLNSARAATEYLYLLDPADTTTSPNDNSMSLGKMFLLAMVVLGNFALLVARRAEAAGKLARTRARSAPMKPLSSRTWTMLFTVLALGYVGVCVIELARDIATDTLPRRRVVDVSARDETGPQYERVGREQIRQEQQGMLSGTGEIAPAQRAATRADAEFARLIELRIGEFIAALLTLGIFSFLLGDNRLYRLTEAFMIGGIMAYVIIEKWDRVIKPDWVEPIVAGAQPGGNHWDLFWLVLLVPGCLWYCVYSKKYRWMNQLVVALFIGCAVGPQFGDQVGIIVPHVLDTVQSVWPFVPERVTGQTAFSMERFEHLVFVIVMVLSLLYFIFFFRPKTRAGRGVSYAGRLAMMIGFGAMFGNTVNTRLSWLAPRIGYLLDDWLGKLFGS
ncbi:MAG: hypothetical protein ACE5I3_06220 [Phycisphaerae bacterium]